MEDLFAINDIEVKNDGRIYLKKVEIENYRSIEKDEIEIDKNGVVFSGENGIGKTTRIEAILWALTDTIFDNSTQVTNLLIPYNSEQGTEVKVQLTFDVFGDEVVLTKTLKEKWVKKRGTEDVVLEGSQTRYFYNGVERETKKDYYRLVYKLFGMENAINKIESETKLLSKINYMNFFLNLEYFKTLDNKTLRELVMLIGGSVDITELEMSDMMKLSLKKKDNDLDELKKAIRQNLKEVTKDITAKESEIKTLQGITSNVLSDDDIQNLRDEISDIERDISNIEFDMRKSNDEKFRDLKQQETEIELELERQRNLEAEIKGDQELLAEIKELEETIDEMEGFEGQLLEQKDKAKDELDAVKQSIEVERNKIIEIKKNGSKIVDKKKKLKSDVQLGLAICECCGQTIQAETINKHLQEYDETIKELASQITTLEKSIGAFETERELKQEEYDSILQNIAKREETLYNNKVKLATMRETYSKTLKIATRDDFTSKEVLSIMERLNAVRSQINSLKLDAKIEEKKQQAKILELKTKKEQKQDQIAHQKNAKTHIENLTKSQTELKQLKERLMKLEQLQIESKILEEKYLVEIDSKVSNAFGENIRFKLFEKNVSNDGISPICDMYVKDHQGRWVNAINGVNTGHSIPRLLEFLKLVKSHLEIKDSFVLIDFFESIGSKTLEEMMKYDTQLIATQVVRNQNELKIERLGA